MESVVLVCMLPSDYYSRYKMMEIGKHVGRIDLSERVRFSCSQEIFFSQIKQDWLDTPIFLSDAIIRIIRMSLFVFVQMSFRIKAGKTGEKNPPYHVCTQRHIYGEIMH